MFRQTETKKDNLEIDCLLCWWLMRDSNSPPRF